MQVDFYLLGEDETALPFIAKLISKLYEAKRRVYIHLSSLTAAHELDEYLWTFKDNSFIPHHLVGEGPSMPAPILLGCADLPCPPSDILINLADPIPASLPYAEIIEIVTADPTQKQQSRDHYLAYKRLGAVMRTHEVGHLTAAYND